MKKIIIASSSLLALVVLVLGWLAFCGYSWSWGPFSSLHRAKVSKLDGNEVSLKIEKRQTILSGKRILYLGSSVTYGASSLGESFVEFIDLRNGTSSYKEAVSGTTRSGDSSDSYVSRLKKVDRKEKFDLFVCQLSTNDATKKVSLGEIKDGGYDIHNVTGALQFIVSYAKEVFHCPTMVFSNSYFESERYSARVERTKQLSKKRGFFFIDRYSDGEFNSISDEQRKLYRADKIHPTKAGYYYWWTPYREKARMDYL